MITYLRSKESQHGREEGATAMMPPATKPIPPPKPKKPTNDNTGTDIHQHCIIIVLSIIIDKYTYLTRPPPPPHTYTFINIIYNTQMTGAFLPLGFLHKKKGRISTINLTQVWSALRHSPLSQNTTTRV